MNASLLVGAALGMRHGTDPDHLAAIDGVFFALGHGLVVILLAVGLGHVIAGHLAFLGPWTLILIGVVNLYRILRKQQASKPAPRVLIAQPFLLGMVLAAGFETASQLSALILAGQTNAWMLGACFSGGMVVVDGLDGYLAASTQRLAVTGETHAVHASRLLGLLVVFFSFGLGGAELAGLDLDRFALPLGLTLFATVIAIRVWARTPLQTQTAEAN